MNIKSLFCNHLYNKSVCAKSQKHGNHNHVYDIEVYKCEKCNHCYTVKVLRKIERNYYVNHNRKSECDNCLYEEDNPNIEPCKTCIKKINQI